GPILSSTATAMKMAIFIAVAVEERIGPGLKLANACLERALEAGIRCRYESHGRHDENRRIEGSVAIRLRKGAYIWIPGFFEHLLLDSMGFAPPLLDRRIGVELPGDRKS